MNSTDNAVINAGELKVLLIIMQCNPEWASVPLEGYRYYEGISQRTHATLVTHERNKPALGKIHADSDIVYVSESAFIKRYFKIAGRMSRVKGKVIWPLYHTLTYPVYHEFDASVYQKFKDAVHKSEYDIVHVITPMMPRYPVKLVKACQHTPFIIGPVNGGVPFPEKFKDIARQEYSYLNFFRSIGQFIIPGYRATYQKADYILAGSAYTFNLVKELFNLQNDHIELFHENGITEAFLKKNEETSKCDHRDSTFLNILFVGRLVPYKGADILIDAIGRLEVLVQKRIILTIVGDGPEKNSLEKQVDRLNLKQRVYFTGWVAQPETLKYYRNSDIFCFPSLREFGGAVVLEAMANGLPCIVVDHGGIGEYVTEKTGFKIEPVSRNFVVQEMKKYLERLIRNQLLREEMSRQAVKRAESYTWNFKAEKIVNIYKKVLNLPV